MLRDEEIARLREVAVADPTQSVRLCDLLVAAGRAEEAVRLCRDALRDRTDDVDLRLALGRALSAAGNLEEAQAALFDAVARKRRITRQNIPVVPGLGQNTPPPRTPPPQSEGMPAVVEPGAPTAMLSGGTSRHIFAPATGRPLSGTPQALRPLGEAPKAPAPGPSAPRKLPPVGPPSQRLFGPLPRTAPRFPVPGQPATGSPPPGERSRLPVHEVEAAPPVPDLVTDELTGGQVLPDSPARRGPDSAVTPPPGRSTSAVTPPPGRSASAVTPAPGRSTSAVTPPPGRSASAVTPAPGRSASAVTPSPTRFAEGGGTPPPEPRDAAASGRPQTGSPPSSALTPPLPPYADPLPAELQEPVLPLPQLASIAEGQDEEEHSLVSDVLAAAASTAHRIDGPPAEDGAPSRPLPRPVPIFDSGPAAARAASGAPPAGEPDEAAARIQPAPSPDAPVPAALPVDLSPGPLLYDLEAAARRLLGPDRLPEKAPPPAEKDRGQLLFDRRRRRVFSGLWISVGLVSIGVLVGWATRTATTSTALKRRLGEGNRLAATARYEDLRAARDLYQQAAQIAPHDALSHGRLAEAEARLCADHGEGTEDSAFILLRRAEHEAARDRSGRAAGSLRRAGALLALSRGESCPPLGAQEARAQREDGDVAARCALQRGDVAGSLRLLSGGGAGSVDQLLWRGSLALSLGDLEEADHAYRTVLDLLPGHPRALLGRTLVQAERGGELGAPPIPAGAALGLVGESWLQLLRGLAALRRGDEAMATAAITEAQRGARYDARLGLWVGRAQLDAGRVADAEAALRRAARLAPSDPDLSVLDAEVALAKGHEDRVIRSLAALRPEGGRKLGGRLLSVLGRALYRAGRYREAAQSLDLALAGRPGDLQARSYRLLCRARLGAEREAFHELETLSAGPLPVTTPRYALAVLAYERKDLERAATESQQALVRNPEASWARALRGRVLREQGKLAEAIAELERVAREAPALLPAHQILGRVYLDLGRYREARAELRQVIGSGRATLEDYAVLLDATIGMGLPVEAEQVAREARRAGATAGKLRRAELIAASYKGAAPAQQAARDLEAERRANARDVQLALQTAAAWLRAGDGQSALDVYETLRTRAPLQALLGVGRAQLRQRKGEEAEAAFRAALVQWDKAPYGKGDRAEARGGVCRALLLQGKEQRDDALQEAEAALREAPDTADAHYCLGRINNERGQVATALPAAQRAVELDPTSMDACVLLGDVIYKSKQPAMAKQRYQRCLELAPSSPQARYVRDALSMIK